MFICRACFTKAFSTTINHTLRLPNNATTLRSILASTHPRRQRYATATFSTEFEEQPGTPRDNRPPRRLLRPRTAHDPREWAANKQLQYMKDPLHIANHVKNTLDKGRFDDAALIVRKASAYTKLVVSWNHLIDYQLREGRLHAALKLFNEMKKRAQFPNAQTFTIIFRGCAKSPHTKRALAETVKLYQNMLASDRIKPNIIHLNAALQVCARAQDLDSMFTIVQSANDGLRAPNNLTYTTILNALRRSTEDKHNYTPADIVNTSEVEKDVAQVIGQAKGLWEEVISKWKAGSVVIDEEVVCAMGRILLMGNIHDVDSIGALIEQTMMIPVEDSREIAHASGEVNDPFKNRADPKLGPAARGNSKIKAPGAPSLHHALPGKNSLSLILSALEKTGKTTRAERYWGIFTKRYGVIPDAENWSRLLSVYRRAKNSSRAVAALRSMPDNLMVPKSFRSAMSTCLRDNLNKSSFNNATQVLEIMLTTLRIPDLLTLRTYLRVAYANRRLFIEHHKGNFNAAMNAYGKQLSVALDNLWKPYRIAAKHCVYNKTEPPNSKAEVVALARKMITTYDRLIFNDMLSGPETERLKPMRNHLNRFVVAHFDELKKETLKSDEDNVEKLPLEEDEEKDEEKDEERDDDAKFFDSIRQQRSNLIKRRTITEGW
ncbi:hypothetical protein F5B20DRAFT_21137 [Whalleya microplaca]|nr:hypothetical protein F5B20DRAFT_21137 [Whalleya microplaca]